MKLTKEIRTLKNSKVVEYKIKENGSKFSLIAHCEFTFFMGEIIKEFFVVVIDNSNFHGEYITVETLQDIYKLMNILKEV